MKQIIIFGAKLPLFSETPEESVLNCYDNAPLRASFRALYSTSIGNRRSCYPIKIEGVKEKCYAIYNLKTYPFWNKDDVVSMYDDPHYFGIHDK